MATNCCNAFFLSRMIGQSCRLLVTLLAGFLPAHGQNYEITPLVGGMFGGTLKLEQQGLPNVEAQSEGSFSFGVAAGFRFDSDDLAGDGCEKCDLVQFRWLRQTTHLALKQNPLTPRPVTTPAFYPAVAFDYFLVDFAHEWNLEDAKKIKPFLSASVGAAILSAPVSNAARFVFGVGTGVEVFPKPRWGIRFQIEYLPIVMNVELQRAVCVSGCVFILGGGIMNRFGISIGPSFRF